MSHLAQEIARRNVASGNIVLWWLGQAGFAFKTDAGKVIYVDPYLSDSVERLHGFKRLSLPAIAPEDVQADLVLVTHEHADHLDPDTIPIIARNNPPCRFAGPAGCSEGFSQAGVVRQRQVVLGPNRTYPPGSMRAAFPRGLSLHTAPADHGDLSPTALAFVLDFSTPRSGVKVLVTGDTAFRPALLKPLTDFRPDVVLPCINGAFGNMGHVDAARLVSQAQPRYAIPCHFWTFAEQGAGDPAGFIHACRCLCPEVQAILLRPGEGFTLAPSDVASASGP